MGSDTSWSSEELSSIDLGDVRLNHRCQRVLELLGAHPGESIPGACGGWAETMGAYRLFAHEQVTLERVLEPHLESTCRRMAEEPVVLCVGDTTQLDFTPMPETDGLGPLARDYQHGLMLHPILAVTPQRLSLGVIDACLWARDPKAFGVRRSNRPKGAETRESYRWIYGYHQLCAVAKRVPSTRLVYVTDREGDITDLLAEAQSGPVDVLIRASHDRKLEDDDKLWEHLESQRPLGTTTFDLPAAPGRPARSVTQQVRVATVILNPAHPDHATLPEISVTVVFAREENPPSGQQPVEWMLLTTRTVTTLVQARVIIGWYRCRWEIEVFFRTLKTGCRVERLQLTHADRLKPAIALYLIITWRLLYLTKLARTCPDVPATVVFDDQEWRLAYYAVKRQPPPKRTPSLRDITRLIAQLGGFLARKSDGEPGPQTIWGGLQRLKDMMIAANALREMGDV